jgi:hypothetical protein
LKGWVFESLGALFRPALAGGVESFSVLLLALDVRNWAFFSAIQPKTRANKKFELLLCDPSFFLLKRPHGDDEWMCETAAFEEHSDQARAKYFWIRRAPTLAFLTQLYQSRVKHLRFALLVTAHRRL